MSYTRNTFVIYDESFFTGMTETLEQASVDFATAGGAVIMGTANKKGELEKASFFQTIAGLVEERDPTDTTDANWNDLTAGETVDVKVHRRSKVQKAVNAFKALGEDLNVMSFVFGQQHGKAVALDWLNTGLASAKAAMLSEAGMTFDATTLTNSNPNPENLVRMRAKMGDASDRLVALVCHSAVAHELLRDQVTSSVSTIAGPSIYQGAFGSLSLPVIVTDSPALIEIGPLETDPTKYYVLGLTESALRLIESEEREVFTRIDDSTANLMARVTVESAYNVGVKGFAYKGGNYPVTADLADAGNWTYAYTDVKSGPGVVGVFTIDEA